MPDPNVIVQYKMNNLGIEAIVRGYVWGSMAKDYETGKREKCGIQLPEGMLRYQKLDEPIFTPTTKAEKDEDMTMEQVSSKIGSVLAEIIRDYSLKLFNMYSNFAKEKGLLLIDTKYEFGTDDKGSLFLIDEATTPDSSRFCYITEWEDKWPKIQEELKTGDYKNVSELLKAKPELKIEELSKQFVRDVLLDRGYKQGTEVPKLTEENVIETALRYIELYEIFTGKDFDLETGKNPRERMINNLKKGNYMG